MNELEGEPEYVSRRASLRASNSSLPPLEENDFWVRTKSFLASHLNKHDYDPNNYIHVTTGPGRTLVSDIEHFLTADNDLGVLLLYGEYGAGKTTSLRHLLHEASTAGTTSAVAKHRFVYFDGTEWADINSNAQAFERALDNTVERELSSSLSALGMTRDAYLDDVLQKEPVFIFAHHIRRAPSGERYALAEKELSLSQSTRAAVGMNFLCRQWGIGNVALVFDNMDQCTSDVAKLCVERATQLAQACKVRAIVTVRVDTLYRLGYHELGIVRPFYRIGVQHPSVIAVIQRRVARALQEPIAQDAKLGEGAHQYYVRDCPEFKDILVRGLDSERTAALLLGLSNGSIRDLLRLATRIYSSPYLDARRIIRKLSPVDAVVTDPWRSIPYYILVKALLLPRTQYYHESEGIVGNAFGTRESDTHVGPFLRLFVLRYVGLQGQQEVPLDDIKRTLVAALHTSVSSVERELGYCVTFRWLAPAGTGFVRRTMRGAYIHDLLHRDLEYLAHVSTDVDLPDRLECKIELPAERFSERFGNAVTLLEHLVQSERRLALEVRRKGPAGFVAALGRAGLFGTGLVESIEQQLSRIEDRLEGSPAHAAHARAMTTLRALKDFAAESARLLIPTKV